MRLFPTVIQPFSSPTSCFSFTLFLNFVTIFPFCCCSLSIPMSRSHEPDCIFEFASGSSSISLDFVRVWNCLTLIARTKSRNHRGRPALCDIDKWRKPEHHYVNVSSRHKNDSCRSVVAKFFETPKRHLLADTITNAATLIPSHCPIRLLFSYILRSKNRSEGKTEKR